MLCVTGKHYSLSTGDNNFDENCSNNCIRCHLNEFKHAQIFMSVNKVFSRSFGKQIMLTLAHSMSVT